MHNLRRSFSYLSIVNRQASCGSRRLASSSSGNEEIVIPNRIHRSPTDILRALSQTVGMDPTAAHYKFHDDPFLMPMSNIGKRTFAMAQESGRKSAKWIRQENSSLFQHKEMDPLIDAFIPTKIYTAESEVAVKDLAGLIKDVEVSDAVLVYNLLQKKSVEIPADLKQSFFEMICFYNSEDPLDEDLIEERWFSQSGKPRERQRKTWRDHELAEQIFAETEPKDTRSMSTIIRGMCKYYQVEKAWAIYNDALARNVELDVEAFNAILNISNTLKESAELRWDLILELLSTMKSMKVDPNLGTLNACLNTISMMGGRSPKDYALKIIGEFKRAGIEPSLASWLFVLQTFCKERGPVSHVIIDILNQIEGKSFEIRDINDLNFFVTAMEVCRYHLHDKNLAKRVDDLLHVGDNYNLIGDSFKESVYYRHFFSLMVATEPLDVFMELYNKLVPNVYIPEPAVTEDILKAVEVAGAIEHIPELWSHIILFEQTTRESILMLLLRIMIQNFPTPSFPQHEHLKEKFGSIAFNMWTRIEEKNENRTKPFVWTAKLLGDIITLQCMVGEYDNAAGIFDRLSSEQDKILGEPDVSAMQTFVQLCITSKQPSKAINCLQYCLDIGFPESRDMAKSICLGFTLDENLTKKVGYLVGIEVLQEAANEKLKMAETN